MTKQMQTANSALSFRPLTDALGAQVSAIDLAAAGDGIIDDIFDALSEHSLLVFRGQQLDPAALVALAGRFGEIYITDKPKKDKLAAGFHEIYVVSNIKDRAGKSIGGLRSGEAFWHSDISYLQSPPQASLLYALEIPDEGGDTGVCSTAAAFRSMPPALRQKIEGRAIKHDATYNAAGLLRHGVERSDDPRAATGTFHPAICFDAKSERRYLYLGRRRNAYVEGLDLESSEALLDELWAHATRPEHVYTHKWSVGDLLMWDNRMTMHRRDAFDPAARRLMHHIRLKGVAPPLAADPGRKATTSK